MSILKGHWQLISLTALVFLLWNTPVVLPLKILVVFMHELSHGLAAVLTGGKIEAISISAQQGGLATTRGGNVFLIMSAGYLGSFVIGMALLLVALRTHADRAMLGICGGGMILIAVFYIREMFGMVFCLGVGAALCAIALKLSRPINDMVLRVIGMTSLIYVPYDIFDDTIARSGIRSDAFMLAERFGGTTVFWGGLWILISLVVIALSVRYGFGRDSNLTFRKPSAR